MRLLQSIKPYVGGPLRLIGGGVPLAVLVEELLNHPLNDLGDIPALEALLDGRDIVEEVAELGLIALGVKVLL